MYIQTVQLNVTPVIIRQNITLCKKLGTYLGFTASSLIELDHNYIKMLISMWGVHGSTLAFTQLLELCISFLSSFPKAYYFFIFSHTKKRYWTKLN